MLLRMIWCLPAFCVCGQENKIGAALRFFDLAVDEYNASIKQFPTNLLAGQSNLGRRQFFDLGLDRGIIEEGPSVKF